MTVKARVNRSSTQVWLQPGERVLRPRDRRLVCLLKMGFMLDQIDIYWPIPESRSFTNSMNFDFFTRQHGPEVRS